MYQKLPVCVWQKSSQRLCWQWKRQKKFAYSSKCLKCENLSDWTSSDNRGRISSKRLFVSLKRTKRTYSKQAMLGRQTSVLHVTDTPWHTCIDFFTYSDFLFIFDEHPSRQPGLCSSQDQSQSSMQGYKWTYRSFPAVLK